MTGRELLTRYRRTYTTEVLFESHYKKIVALGFLKAVVALDPNLQPIVRSEINYLCALLDATKAERGLLEWITSGKKL